MKYTLTLQLLIIHRVGLDTMQTATRNALIYCVLMKVDFCMFGYNSAFSGTVHVKCNFIKMFMLKFV
jgi:hypothetical protein